MRVRSIGAILILITCLVCACKKFSDTDTVTRIKVTPDGTIFLNGSKASVEDVKKNLEQLKANKGRVRYFRENPQGEAPAQAVSVIKAITDAGVPIKLCTSEDDLNGTQ